MNLSKAWKWFLQAMFPSKCLICNREGFFLCKKHHKFSVSPKSQVNFKYLDEIFASVAYNDQICQKLIEYFKFRGISDIAEIMANQITKNNERILKNSILVPIPLHWTRKLWRGFNQSEILAKEIAKLIPSAQIENLLKRTQKTQQQARLSKKDRIKNTENAFEVLEISAKLDRKAPLILIDDVVASGATLDSAAKVLKLGGFKNMKAIVFARGGEI